MAKTTKTMRLTLTEDFLVPTNDGNIIFEPGDEIEIEYDDEDLAVVDEPMIDAPISEPAPIDATDVIEDPIAEVPPTGFVAPEVPAEEVPAPDNFSTGAEDPLSFAANPEVSEEPEEEEEVYIEDPITAEYI